MFAQYAGLTLGRLDGEGDDLFFSAAFACIFRESRQPLIAFVLFKWQHVTPSAYGIHDRIDRSRLPKREAKTKICCQGIDVTSLFVDHMVLGNLHSNVLLLEITCLVLFYDTKQRAPEC